MNSQLPSCVVIMWWGLEKMSSGHVVLHGSLLFFSTKIKEEVNMMHFRKKSLRWIKSAKAIHREWASLIAQLVKNLPAMQETPVLFLGQEDLLEKGQVAHSSFLELPLWLSCQIICLQCRRPGFSPCLGKILWRWERLLTSVFWPGEFHGLYSPWSHKESDTTERQIHRLNKVIQWNMSGWKHYLLICVLLCTWF